MDAMRPSTGLILTSPPKITVDQCLAEQNNLCFSCGSTMVREHCNRCCYTGKIYCPECMDQNHAFYLPHTLLNSLDLKEYPVSNAAHIYLNQMYSVPVLPLSLVKKQLAER